MSVQSGQLLVVRTRLTLPPGVTTVNTGICQVNIGVDPPVGGEDPTVADPAGTASRVMVFPMAPVSEWGSVQHSEPRLNTPTGTVVVDFFNPGDADVSLNVCFWDPHTIVGPVSAEPYNVLTCFDPEQTGFSQDFVEDATLITVANPATDSGEAVFAFISYSVDAQFSSSGSDPEPVDAGWTLVRRGGLDLGSDTGVKLAVFFRVSDIATDPANYQFTCPLPGFGNSSGNAYALAYGTNYQVGDTPYVDAAVTVETTPGSPLVIDAPSITIPAGYAPAVLLSYFLAAQNADAFWTTPAGMTQVFQQTVLGTPPATVIAINEEPIATAGATGVRNSSSTDANPTTGMAYSLAVLRTCSVFASE